MPTLPPDQVLGRVDEFIRSVENFDPIDAAQVLLPLVGELLGHDGYDFVEIDDAAVDRGWDVRAGRYEDSEREDVAVEYKHTRTPLSSPNVRQMVGKADAGPFDRFLLISRAGFSRSALDEVAHTSPIRVELLTLEDVRQWAARTAVPPPPPAPRVQALVTQLSAGLARAIAEEPRALDSIEWRDMERLLAVVLESLGFEAELTPPAKDGGKDIILRITDKLGELRSFIVEVKHWRSGKRVGSTILSNFVEVVAHEEHEAGLILATYGFTSNATAALTEVDRARVKLGREPKIVSLCRTYVRSRIGLWSPLEGEELAEMLLTDTL